MSSVHIAFKFESVVKIEGMYISVHCKTTFKTWFRGPFDFQTTKDYKMFKL